MNRDPLITTVTLTALAAALIGLVVAFGLPLTKDQEKAIMTVVAILAPIAVGVVAQRKVTTSAQVVAQTTPTGGVVAGPASIAPNGVPVTVLAEVRATYFDRAGREKYVDTHEPVDGNPT